MKETGPGGQWDRKTFLTILKDGGVSFGGFHAYNFLKDRGSVRSSGSSLVMQQVQGQLDCMRPFSIKQAKGTYTQPFLVCSVNRYKSIRPFGLINNPTLSWGFHCCWVIFGSSNPVTYTCPKELCYFQQSNNLHNPYWAFSYFNYYFSCTSYTN